MAEGYDETLSNYGGRSDTAPMEKAELHLAEPLQHESSDTFDLQRELRVAQENNSKLAEKLGKIQNSYKLKSTDLDAATTKIQDLEASVRSLRAQEDELKANHMEEVIAYKDANYDLEKLLKKLSTRVKELESSKDDLLEKAKALAEENTRLSESLKQLNVEKSTQKRSFQKQNPGDQLSNNNPDIADLSDEYRPTKLVEKYQELYDNQRTNAFEMAEEFFLNETEKTIITALQQILQNVYQFCNEEVAEQEKDFMKAMFRISDTKELHSAIPENIRIKLNELKRFAVTKSTEYLLEKYLMSCDKTNQIGRFTEHCKDYVLECINLCWHMVNQNPPVVLHLGVNSGDTFDGSMYKHYTMTGTVIDFVVWPALLLFEYGSVLSKGVVQCVKLSQDSQSVRARSKQVTSTESGIPSGSSQLTSTVAHGNVADLTQTKAQSELNQNHGQSMKRDQKSKTEKVHSEFNVKLSLPTDSSKKPMKNAQLHTQHSTVKNSQGDIHQLIPTDSQCQDKKQISKNSCPKQATDEVVNDMQKTSRNIHHHETASDYVHEFQGHEDRSQQTQINAANFQQYQPNAGDVRQVQPNNYHNYFPNNGNVSQPNCGTFKQYQSNTGISKQQQQQHHHHQQQKLQQQQQWQQQHHHHHQHQLQQQQQHFLPQQSNTGVGQAPCERTSAQAMYGNQHQQPLVIDDPPNQQEFDFFIRMLHTRSEAHARLCLGDKVVDRLKNYMHYKYRY